MDTLITLVEMLPVSMQPAAFMLGLWSPFALLIGAVAWITSRS